MLSNPSSTSLKKGLTIINKEVWKNSSFKISVRVARPMERSGKEWSQP